jgi:KTSC domain
MTTHSKSVKSSFIDSLSYDDEKNILHMQFTNGTVTSHYDCPKEVFDGMCEAQSVGKHYHQHVRGRFKTEK